VGVVLVTSLCAALLIGGIVVAVQLLSGGGFTAPGPVSRASDAASPTPSAPATSPGPTAVELTDHGGSVTLRWADPSHGQVPFLISGGRDGNALLVLASVPAGQNTTTIYGLNENFDYCFTVAAVWSADLTQESIRTCTDRTVATSGTTAA
jgi:hypothetical protein